MSKNNMPNGKWDIFIAHAGPDSDVAVALFELLEPHCRPFVDKRSLLLGDDWDQALARAQQNCLVTVVLISSNTERAYYQREEIAAAIAMAREDSGAHRVVPIYLDKTVPITKSVPYGLRLKNSLTITDNFPLSKAAEALVQLLSSISPLTNSNVKVPEEPFAPPVMPKYYVYVSSTKVDMLFEQIKLGARGRGTIRLGSNSSQLGATEIYAKTAAVIEHLESSGQIGTIDSPKPYFKGILKARWGEYGDGLVYFGGTTEATIVGLGGSMYNVIGSSGASRYSFSTTPAIIQAMRNAFDEECRKGIWSRMVMSALERAAIQKRPSTNVMHEVENATAGMSGGPEQTIDFVARKLMWTGDDKTRYITRRSCFRTQTHVLLGSPIYVAIVDQ